MLETIISSTTGESFTLVNALIVISASILLGLVLSCVYIKLIKKNGYSSGFSLTLIMLPVIISIIILLVGNNVARAFSLAGAFSIIRLEVHWRSKRYRLCILYFSSWINLRYGIHWLRSYIYSYFICFNVYIRYN